MSRNKNRLYNRKTHWISKPRGKSKSVEELPMKYNSVGQNKLRAILPRYYRDKSRENINPEM